MIDLIDRLEEAAQWDDIPSSLIHEAIARIAALEAQLAEAKEAFSRMVALYESEFDPDAVTRPQWVRDALSALEATPPAPKDEGEPIRNGAGEVVAYRDYAGNVGWVGSPPKQKPAPKVTEAMVAAAVKAFEKTRNTIEGKTYKEEIRSAISDALIAAQESGAKSE